MTTEQYISNLAKRYALGNATEHTFRGDLQQLIEDIMPKISATNEPKRQKCGAPDYILTQNNIPIGYIEVKNIGDKDLIGAKATGNKEQFDRYKKALGNIIFTDYLDFYLYVDGEFQTSIAIGELKNGNIIPKSENFNFFTSFIKDFCAYQGQTIDNPKKLAEMMAGKAQILSLVIENALNNDKENKQDSSLKEQLNAFDEVLIPHIKPKEFADVYAQTIAYGMFTARLHDEVSLTFTRQKTNNLIPKSNPFLKKLFDYIAGDELDTRIIWIVDALAEIFSACDIQKILQHYQKNDDTEDPIIHFYETFLTEYDPILRKARGVWYTPTPVVSFIVRAVDQILKTDFNLPDGLADVSKISSPLAPKGGTVQNKQDIIIPPLGVRGLPLGVKGLGVHKVQILDPATGTGTFLAEVIKHIYKKFEGQTGIWQSYVENDLVPRLNGFELLMASYAMAHLKLDLLLAETGYKPKNNERLKIFLTNTLSESVKAQFTVFGGFLTEEAVQAHNIKANTPVMCIIGNPPYSGESANQNAFIERLMLDYKKEPEGKVKLQERNPKWINDDYVKFIRFSSHLIENNGEGIVAFINPHGFLDNPTFRGMRWHLLKTFDKIYTIDLHGNAKKKETAPDGSPDQNVFDIMQGVSINIFVKTAKKKPNELAQVFHYDLFGKRKHKYDFLNNTAFEDVPYKLLPNKAPMYFMVQKNDSGEDVYKKGFALDELFVVNGVGITTAHDEFVINEQREKLLATFQDFQATERDENVLHKKFDVAKKEGWDILQGYDNIKKETDLGKFIKPIAYRPFDTRSIFYEGKLVWRTVEKVMQHFVDKQNVGLVFRRQQPENLDFYLFCSKDIVADGFIRSDNKGGESLAPLYVYPEKVKKKKKLFVASSEQVIHELNIRIKDAQKNYDKLNKIFTSKIELFFNKIKVVDKNVKALFEEHETTVEDAKMQLEVLKEKLSDTLKANLAENDDIENELSLGLSERKANFKKEIIEEFAQGLGLAFVEEDNNKQDVISPINVLDYIYSVLHSPTYRETYKSFLKTAFPRVPYPQDKNEFWALVALGKKLRTLHLLENKEVESYMTTYPITGDNIVKKPSFVDNGVMFAGIGRVYINDTQYFDGVPKVVWEFYIGGYQPVQKWLKDRKEKPLNSNDILHYQKIIVALFQTDTIMKEIDTVLY